MPLLVGGVLAGIFAIIALLSFTPPTGTTTGRAATAYALNFEAYREAVIAYVEANPTYTGTVPTASLTMPPGWSALAAWNNQVATGGTVYVWGALPQGSAADVATAGLGTVSIGVTKMQGGVEVVIVPSTGYVIPVNITGVPVGDVACVVQIN